MPRIRSDSVRTSSIDFTTLTPPPLPRPPAWIWAFTTQIGPGSFSAAALTASSAVNAGVAVEAPVHQTISRSSALALILVNIHLFIPAIRLLPDCKGAKARLATLQLAKNCRIATYSRKLYQFKPSLEIQPKPSVWLQLSWQASNEALKPHRTGIFQTWVFSSDRSRLISMTRSTPPVTDYTPAHRYTSPSTPYSPLSMRRAGQNPLLVASDSFPPSKSPKSRRRIVTPNRFSAGRQFPRHHRGCAGQLPQAAAGSITSPAIDQIRSAEYRPRSNNVISGTMLSP